MACLDLVLLLLVVAGRSSELPSPPLARSGPRSSAPFTPPVCATLRPPPGECRPTAHLTAVKSASVAETFERSPPSYHGSGPELHQPNPLVFSGNLIFLSEGPSLQRAAWLEWNGMEWGCVPLAAGLVVDVRGFVASVFCRCILQTFFYHG